MQLCLVPLFDQRYHGGSRSELNRFEVTDTVPAVSAQLRPPDPMALLTASPVNQR